MSKKLLSVCSLLVVTGLAGTVLAAAKQWTNANPVYDSWCEPGNWSPSGVPGSSDTAIIDATSPDRGPVIDCTAQALLINGPSPADGNTQVVDVCDSAILTAAPGSENEGDGWEWRHGAGTAVINITGTASVTIGGRHWRGPDQARGEVYVTGNPTIVAEHDFRGADAASGFFYFDMSSGNMEVKDDFVIGDVGGGAINMRGGSLIIKDDFDLGGVRGSAPITVNMTGGSIRVGGHFFLPGNENRAGVVVVHLDGGVIDCNELIHGGADGGQDGPPGMYSGYTDEWLLHISGGQLEIRGDVRDEIDANVAAGQIIAYEREGTVVVNLVDGNTVITALPPDPNRALNPCPKDLTENVDPDALISWKPGVNAATHHIYLGTDFDDVNTADTTSSVYMTSQPVDQNSYDPNGPDPLKLITTYYWRIDEANGASVWKGRVWEFTTRAAIVDPNMLLWYKFDESSGTIAADYSGYGNHASISTEDVVPPNWEPNDGHDGGALRFDTDGEPMTLVQPPTDVLDNLGQEVSIAVWLKDAYHSGDDNWVFDSGAGGEGGLYHVQAAVVTAADKDVLWRAGDDSNDALHWDLDGQNPAMLEGWHHWTFIKDEAADEMKIYFDGQEVASQSGVFDTLVHVRGTPFVVGAPTWTNWCCVGSMDGFRLYDRALSEKEVQEIVRGGELGKAWAPTPYDRAQNVVRDVVLEWNAGNFAVTHDVFFGTSFADVNDATTSTPEIYRGSKNLGDERYEPGILTLTQKYYWRIDEVNTADVNSPWKGSVWTFTVANFLVVDDMEDYDDDASVPQNPINGTWIDGWWNNTGSTVYLEYGSGATVRSGAKSMWLEYNNNFGYPVENYSEIHANTATGDKNLGFGRDWTADGMKALSLFFYGASDNAIEPLYVVLEDTSGANSVSNYGDQGQELSDITVPEWRQWDMDLQDFNDGGVNIKDVNRIYIGLGDRDNPVAGGTGVLYIDDIRLYLPRCVPHLAKPAADFSNNCIVDLADVGIMAGEWLRTDANLSVTPPRDPPVGWWKLDGDATDSSTSAYHGTVEGTYAWVSGHIDQAIRFSGSGGRVLVADGGTTPLLRPADQISVTAWVKYSEPTGYSSRAVAKGVDAGDRENFALQVSEHAGDWFVRDANTKLHSAGGSARLSPDEWNHLAGTFDGSAVSLYVNGQLEQSEDVNAMTLLQDSNALSIGDAVDVYRAFMGRVDDVRVYDYGLSAEEVAYIATESTGGAGTAYMPLRSVANLYDTEIAGQKAVNLRDYATVMEAWLDEQLWP